MLIDWFTLFAQITNFLILIWLLKRFLYKPILRCIEEREKLIENRLDEAKSTMQNAQKEKEDYEQKIRVWNQQRESELASLQEELKAERLRLLHETRTEFDLLQIKQKEFLKREHELLADEFRSRIKNEVFLMTRKTLTDLADADLEELMVKSFLKRLDLLSEQGQDQFRKLLKKEPEELHLRSTFPLKEVLQESIIKKIHALLNTDSQIHFEICPELVSGIEFLVDGYKVSWSIDDYLESIEAQIPIGGELS